jgi:ATP-dependent DNA ligase
MTSQNITIRDFRSELPGRLRDGTWYFPTVRATNKLGKEIEWTIFVKAIQVPAELHNKDGKIAISELTSAMFISVDGFLDNHPALPNQYGYIAVESRIADGKIRATVPDIVYKGKNLKSKSATNAVCQALRDALSKYNKQASKAVVPQLQSTFKMYPPMLAQVFADQKKPIPYPVSVQRKYNGIRVIATLNGDNVELYSRKLKPYFGFEQIRKECKILLTAIVGTTLYLDGELYKHGEALQTLSGVARREINTDEALDIEKNTQMMIYDCFTEGNTMTYAERQIMLASLFANQNLTTLTMVETFDASSKSKVDELYKKFLAEGYEGAMIRINDAKYDFAYNDRHSKSLLKMKETFDAEFKIIGWETGSRGKAANALMIVCETTTNVKFNCTPALPLDEREKLASEMTTMMGDKTFFETTYLNKMVIVYFDEKSKDGVPQRARTKMEIRTWD